MPNFISRRRRSCGALTTSSGIYIYIYISLTLPPLCTIGCQIMVDPDPKIRQTAKRDVGNDDGIARFARPKTPSRIDRM